MFSLWPFCSLPQGALARMASFSARNGVMEAIKDSAKRRLSGLIDPHSGQDLVSGGAVKVVAPVPVGPRWWPRSPVRWVH